MKTCKQCSKEIKQTDFISSQGYVDMTKYNRAVFCSRNCCVIWKRENQIFIKCVCAFCGNTFLKKPYLKTKVTCSSRCKYELRALTKKTSYMSKGYVYILTNSKWANKCGYESEHRVIMREKLGRPLEHWEDVHHINGIRHDNRVENLIVMSQTKHLSLHKTNKIK